MKQIFLIILVLAQLSIFAGKKNLKIKELVVGTPSIDPLVDLAGNKVTKETWPKRRSEILELFKNYVYGKAPIGKPKSMTFEQFDYKKGALGGTAIRKQIKVYFTKDKTGPSMNILIYLPLAAKKPVPVFLGMNFWGNHTVIDDKAIKITGNWDYKKRLMSEKGRGVRTSRWPIKEILKQGYGLMTIHNCDVDPDFDDSFKNGVHKALEKHEGKRPANAWGSVATWAWALSRAMDYIETDKDIEEKAVAVLGHSRLGKTALWAGATDERFALVIGNDSGCTGAAYSRRKTGETVGRINRSFPHWFCGNYKKFNEKEDELPVDQHMLIALMAPRPVYVGSASKDLWADPRGGFLSCIYAGPVYRLLGKKDLGTIVFPKPGVAYQNGDIGYHLREGTHNLTLFDWQNYMKFADKYFKK